MPNEEQNDLPQPENDLSQPEGGQTEISLKAELGGLQPRDSILIGRGVECNMQIQDPKASRQHARLTRTESGFVLEDLGSRNGTSVSGQKIQAQVTLNTKDSFKIGDTIFYLA